MKIIIDISPLFWKFPSGISFHVNSLFDELIRNDKRKVGFYGVNLGARFFSSIKGRSFKGFWFPSKKFFPNLSYDYIKKIFKADVFIATNHFIPKTEAVTFYYIYDCIKLKYPKEMNCEYDVEYDRIVNLYTRADYILTNSESARKDVIKFFGDSKKIYVCPVGIDEIFYTKTADKVSVEKDISVDLEQPFIYTCGVMQARKRFDWSAWLVNELETVNTLVISGAINDEGRLFLKKIQKQFPSISIVHIGLIRRDIQKRLYEKCKLFVFPSLYEGFGMPIVEAMAAGGGPVLCSDTSSMSEIVISTRQKFLVESKQDFFNKAEHLLSLNNTEVQAIKNKNMQVALKFSTPSVANKLEKIIYDVVGE